MRLRVLAIFLILAIGTALGDGHDLLTEYSFSSALAGDDYILHWTADLQGKELGIAVNVSTTGWVGFGISPNGQMPGSDVVIAWVDSNGETFLQVRLLKSSLKTLYNAAIFRTDMQPVDFYPLLMIVKTGYLSVAERKMEGQL